MNRILSAALAVCALLTLGPSSAMAGGRKPKPMPVETEITVPVAQAPAAEEPVRVESVPIDVTGLPGVGTHPPQDSSNVKIQKVWIWQETSDCLWNMAKEHYGNPFLWTKIYEANRLIIKNPHVIFPKQRIVIPPRDE